MITKKFKAELRHDNGTFTIITAATSKEAAIELIMGIELCPESAITKIEEI